MKMKLLSLCFLILLLSFSFPFPVFAVDESEYLEVSLSYLSMHREEFCGKEVRVIGTVDFLYSIYMFEDFWLSRTIPVVVRFANLSMPLENSRIEVFGVIEYCKLEGGFFYLNAHYWRYVTARLPEFGSWLILPLAMAALTLSILVYKKWILRGYKRHSLDG